ncbi:hypothetical protein FAM15346_001058 [Propionibacterium freudenreichii]|nr:hypothetical protein [Propionibacterium freudenreichii]MDK9644040.1 hypothetical protein [Propionibacterium freudenreichii]MDK9649378.1 hypothetical protein [Propionibacterium freudenreichii]
MSGSRRIHEISHEDNIDGLGRVAGAAALEPVAAHADGCIGNNSYFQTGVDPEAYMAELDSCGANELINALPGVQNAAGLAAMLGAKWAPVSPIAGALYGSAWWDVEKLRGCASAGTGIVFTQTSGIVVYCAAQ